MQTMRSALRVAFGNPSMRHVAAKVKAQAGERALLILDNLDGLDWATPQQMPRRITVV